MAVGSNGQPDIDALVRGVVEGDRRLLARSLRLVDDDPELGRRLAAALHDHRTGAEIIGFTGSPGAGKSTIVDRAIESLRAAGRRVGVLAVDPSSPFSGGAILGDRIRMSRHFEDDGVFIRSLATRGALGGLSRSTFDSVRVLDAAGFDAILIETVGVGQDEVDVVRLADTTVVILVPGMGDDIQAIKAGLLEIADVFVVNKADRDGAPEVERGLHQLLSLAPAGDWEPPIVKTVAPRNEGIAELLEQVEAHRAFLGSPDGLQRVRRQRRDLFERLLDASLVDHGRKRLRTALDEARGRVIEQDADPYAVIAQMLGGMG